MYMKNGMVFYVVYAIDDQNSLNEARTFVGAIERYFDYYKKQGPYALVLIGNKSDLETSRQVSQQEGQELAKSYNAEWLEISGITNN